MNEYTSTLTFHRFRYEFWLIAALVALDLIPSVQIGFYRFRLSDLILLLCIPSALNSLIRRKWPNRVTGLLVAYIATVVIRALIELSNTDQAEILRTLGGMTATYLAPIIFFVVRSTTINKRQAMLIIVASCLIAFFSQLGLTGYGENYATGILDLSSFLNREVKTWTFDYQENSIALWRSLSVGTTFALLLCRTKPYLKIVGLIGLLLQFSGGGGGRSALLIAFFLPIILFFYQTSARRMKIRKMGFAIAAGLAFALFYLWAPQGGDGAVKGKYEMSHSERALEIFSIVTGDWEFDPETGSGGFEGRTVGYEQYIEGILSSPTILIFGTGFSFGAAFKDTPNVLAHNMILDVWGLSGILGLAFFLVFLFYVYRDFVALLKGAQEGSWQQIVSFSFAGAMIYMAQFVLFQAVTADRSFMIVFYLLAGVFAPLTRLFKDQEPSKESKIEPFYGAKTHL